MESGRFVPPQARWENNSALASFNAPQDPDHRIGGGFGGRGFHEGKYVGDNVFPRDPYRRDMVSDRDGYVGPAPGTGLLPPSRRSAMNDGFGVERQDRIGFEHNIRDGDRYYDLDRVPNQYYHSDSYQEGNRCRDYGHYRRGGFPDRYQADGYDYDHRPRSPGEANRERGQDLDYVHSQQADHDFEYDRRHHDRRLREQGIDGNWERDRERSPERGRYYGNRSRSYSRSPSYSRSHSWSRSNSHDGSHERSYSPRRSRSPRESRSSRRSRSLRRSYSPHRSRSPRSRSWSRRDESGDDGYHESSWRRDRDDRRYYDRARVAPSATLVVKGLSQRTVEDDLYKALVAWGPLRHVRVIKERSSGTSRGFAFIDFPSVDAARKTMEGLREDGLVLDGRRVYFEYSSKPTGGASQAQLAGADTGFFKHGSATVDWMCTTCGCVNFARRTLCFQCNEGRADDAPAADVSLSVTSGRKGCEGGPTHILVVRGLEEHVNEDMLHTEFSKYAPLKDVRLVRDKFTHVSRGFAFVHFHTVEEAAAALEATNGTALEKNGPLLRVAFAKSSGPGLSSQASSMAAAAIEAATFAQQYNSAGRIQQPVTEGAGVGSANANGTPQSGYVWDEASGYYFDAASGFYYDPHRGLFYDGNHGFWYSYDEKTQQYVPYVEQNSGAATATGNDNGNITEPEKDHAVHEKSPEEEGEITPAGAAEAMTPAVPETYEEEKKMTLAEAVQAAALAAQAAAKKDKEKLKEKEKEIRLAMKGSLLASKKKLLTLWKQRQNEGPIATPPSVSEKPLTTTAAFTAAPSREQKHEGLSQSAAASLSNLSSPGYSSMKKIEQTKDSSRAVDGRGDAAASQSASSEMNTGSTSYRTDASALGSYAPSSGKRRFTEAPQPIYRDRAAERRSLYGSSSLAHDDILLEMELKEKGKDNSMDMPFPPGVGPKGSAPLAGSSVGAPEVQAFDVITAETAIDERNVGNRMLRSMGWQEGSGLGKDGTGIIEPVQAMATDVRAGLGSQAQQRKVDPRFETQPGDSYRVVIQKKALARFHEIL